MKHFYIEESAKKAKNRPPKKPRRRAKRLLALGGALLAAGVGAWLFWAQPWTQRVSPAAASAAVSPGDTRTFLVILTDADSGAPRTFVLLGVDAPASRTVVAPLSGTLAVAGGSLADVFSASGGAAAAAACAKTLGVPVDYYWTQDASAFAQGVDTFGGVDVTLPAAASGTAPHGAQVQLAAGAQHLGGTQAAALACYGRFDSETAQKEDTAALFSALLVQKSTDYYLDPDVFAPLFDLARTDFNRDSLLRLSRVFRAAAKAGRSQALLLAQTDGGLSQADKARVKETLGSQRRVYAP